MSPATERTITTIIIVLDLAIMLPAIRELFLLTKRGWYWLRNRSANTP